MGVGGHCAYGPGRWKWIRFLHAMTKHLGEATYGSGDYFSSQVMGIVIHHGGKGVWQEREVAQGSKSHQEAEGVDDGTQLISSFYPV